LVFGFGFGFGFVGAWVCFLRGESVAGGGPAAAHFSCSAKKSKQKKAAAKPLPLRGPRLEALKTGKK
jgi:hypothetical protein